MPLLDVKDLHAYYGKSHVLQGVNLRIEQGEIVSLLGRNGVGRSTTVKAIMGLVNSTGSIQFEGQAIGGLRTYEIANRGLAYVPENRDVFPALTVEQNLILGEQRGKQSQWTVDDMYELFPRLKERRHTPAGVMSGGEQQMLTLCRSLMGNPKLIMIDEPTEGLAPRIVEQVAQYLDTLRQRGVAVLLVEQKLAIALDISQRLYVMGRGTIVFEGTPDDLRSNHQVRKDWLEV
ncbi:MAG TPA: ABC transporter ATP-binding protein [Burkholderiaceae bacterium]|nr:ABC transporter ATP-binding protein [Burkholderiaceae bacterium]